MSYLKLLLTLLPTLCLAAITNITYTVTNFTTGCSPAACAYTFNISGTAAPSGLGGAFSTYCSGNDLQGKLVSCASSGVQANLVPETEGLVLEVYREVGEFGGGASSGDDSPKTLQGNATAVEKGEGEPVGGGTFPVTVSYVPYTRTFTTTAATATATAEA